MGATTKPAAGGCLCGAVRFTMPAPPGAASICHCAMCRRWAGGPMMAVHPKTPLCLESADTLAWYVSSEWAERGFCTRCGSALFYRLRHTPDDIVASAGALDDPAALAGIERHIFIDDKPPFYEFADECPRLTGAEAMAAFAAAQQGD